MDDIEEIYIKCINTMTLRGLTKREAFERIGLLIDVSIILKRQEGLEHAIHLSKMKKFKKKLNSVEKSTLYYYLGNAWGGKKKLNKDNTSVHTWEIKEIEKEITYFRKALKEEGFNDLQDELKCSIYTNIGNVLDTIGRFVEAIEYWDRALDYKKDFAMAWGNRGRGLISYATELYDIGHQPIFLRFALADLKEALSINEGLYLSAKEGFERKVKWIKSVLKKEFIEEKIDLNTYPMGETKDEKNYREWCLKRRLFLNPLNDVIFCSIAAHDVFHLPSIRMDLREGPYFHSFYNQLKQEFISSRYLLYEGITSKNTHFSDRNVMIYDSLDYPIYSLAIEKVKMAYRIAYSLFDKIALFIKYYFNLPEKEKDISFREVWYKPNMKKPLLKETFLKRKNWPLTGLFWLSKDLYEERSRFKQHLEPEAQLLHEIRNYLEHRYVKVHDTMWEGKEKIKEPDFSYLIDRLSFSLYRKDLIKKSMKIFKLARAGLIYLSLAIHDEEKKKPIEKVGEIPLLKYHDEWKT